MHPWTPLRALALCLLAAALGAGCSANPGGKVPVASPIYAFQPVDPDEYAAEEEDDDAADDAADDSGE